MGNLLFNRNTQVQIGDNSGNNQAPSSLRKYTTTIAIPENPFIEKLKIDFSISLLQSVAAGDENFIKLYNLSDRTQSFIKDQGQTVKLLAGYDNQLATIFEGTLTQMHTEREKTRTESVSHAVVTTREASNIVTTLLLGNQTFNIAHAFFSKSYAGFVSVKTIINEAIVSYQLNHQGLDILPQTQLFNFSWDGRTKDLFDFLLKPAEIEWFVENSVIKFVKLGQSITEDVILLSPETGLINIPTKTDKGVSIKTLLNTQITLGSKVEIVLNASTTTTDGRRTNQLMRELNGLYKVIEITHKGSSYDGEMITFLEAVAL